MTRPDEDQRRHHVGRELPEQDRGPRHGPGEEVGQGPALDLVGHERSGEEEGAEGHDVADVVDGDDHAVEVEAADPRGQLRDQDQPVDGGEHEGKAEQEGHERAAPAPDEALQAQAEDLAGGAQQGQRPRGVPGGAAHRATRYLKTDSRSSSGEYISETPATTAAS